MNSPERLSEVKNLRRDAEEKLRVGPKLAIEATESMSPELMQILIHELRVHQIELELQNEELRRAQTDLDASRSRYFELYDLAPVGYCTLSERGLIVESNLTACQLLGIPRSAMTRTPFSRFILQEDQEQFYFHRNKLLTSDTPQSCELRLRHQDRSTVWVQLVSRVAEGPDGDLLLRIALTDISSRKAAEQALQKSEEFQHSIFDSLAEQIAVLDEQGTIVAVNEAWRQFSSDNCGTAKSENPIGVNYLQICAQASSENSSEHSTKLNEAMRAILDGHQVEFSLEYPCHAADKKRWFHVHVTRMRGLKRGLLVSHENVTHRKLAELALEESQRELVLVANHVPGPVARIDRNLRYLFANNHYEQFFGKELNQVIGHRMIDVLGADLFRQVEPHVQRALMGEHVTFESVYRSADGRNGHTLVNYVPDCDVHNCVVGFFVLAIDITERKLAEEGKNEALKLLQKVTSRVPGTVYQFRLSPDGKVSMPYSNEGLYQLLGVHPEDAREDATKVLANAHPDDFNELVASIQCSARDMTPWKHECRFLVSGKEKWLAGNSVPERAPDGSVLWHGFITDVSERREAEAARAALESQLRESQKMEAIGTLAGGIAHDFNNVLASILGNVELAQQASHGNDSIRQHLREIHQSGLRARNLVQQILSYCRQQPTELRPLSLPTVINDAMAILRATVPPRFTLNVQYEESPYWILADATQIEQVVINLVTNAVQAIGNHTGRIEIRIDALTLDDPDLADKCLLPATLESDTDQIVRLSVSDDGPGIIPSILDRIFEPFFTTKPLGEGTGLGLSVVQGIVKRHGGSIHVDSVPGQGTRFEIFFPAIPAVPCAPSPKDEPVSPSDAIGIAASAIASPPAVGQQILLIDDDPAVLKISRLMLERIGYKVRAYSDPLAALDSIRGNLAAFQLVITDYNMPVMPGLAVAAAVHQLCPDVPIAVSSGYVDDQLRAGAARAGVTELISKPFTAKELSEKLERIFK